MVAKNCICRCSSTLTSVSAPPRNLAELLSDLGRVLHWRLRRAAGAKRVFLLLRLLRWDSRSALGFASLSVSIQFRAMVEDWPLHRIQATVQAQASRQATLEETTHGGTF
jgi:hypothetical protein